MNLLAHLHLSDGTPASVPSKVIADGIRDSGVPGAAASGKIPWPAVSPPVQSLS